MNVEQTIFNAELNGSPFNDEPRPFRPRPRKDEVQGAPSRPRDTLGGGLASAALAAAAVGALWQAPNTDAVPAIFPSQMINASAGRRAGDGTEHATSSRFAAISNDAAPSATEPGWSSYLNEVVAGYLTSEQSSTAKVLWEHFRQVSNRFPLPHAGVVHDGRFAMAWDVGRHHLDVEVNRDGTFDWFYMDRETRDADDGEGCSAKRLGAVDRRARALVG